MTRYGRIVLLGFGGPENPQEIRPFLDRVLEGRSIPPARYEEVVRHYELIGGKSPFNELTQRQANALQTELQRRGMAVPVETAYKNAAPFIDDLARRLAAPDAERVLGVILAVHQSPASWEKYRTLPNAQYTPPFFDNPKFVQANVERVRDALSKLGKTSFDDTALIFTAHSIPRAMADRSPYAQQFRQSAEAIAAAAGAPRWTLAYQSRSGSPADPWLEPDVRDVLMGLPADGVRDAVVAPIGFVCDHVEVLYDLDVDAQAAARDAGIRMERAQALNDHPLFISMLADLIEECAA
jgi:ferrochelatase